MYRPRCQLATHWLQGGTAIPWPAGPTSNSGQFLISTLSLCAFTWHIATCVVYSWRSHPTGHRHCAQQHPPTCQDASWPAAPTHLTTHHETTKEHAPVSVVGVVGRVAAAAHGRHRASYHRATQQSSYASWWLLLYVAAHVHRLVTDTSPILMRAGARSAVRHDRQSILYICACTTVLQVNARMLSPVAAAQPFPPRHRGDGPPVARLPQGLPGPQLTHIYGTSAQEVIPPAGHVRVCSAPA